MSFSNQYSQGRRKGGRARYVWILVALMIAGLIASGFALNKVSKHPEWTRPVAEYYGQAASWVAERKQRLKQTAAAVKKNVEVSNDPDRVVNFEFYNTLEDMQSMQSAVNIEETQSKNLAAEQKAKPKKPARITQAADLERDMLATIKQQGGGKSK